VILALSQCPSAVRVALVRTLGGSGCVPLFIDPDCGACGAWSLGRSTLTHFMGRPSLTEVGRLARTGSAAATRATCRTWAKPRLAL
jgi:hypothetical protein